MRWTVLPRMFVVQGKSVGRRSANGHRACRSRPCDSGGSAGSAEVQKIFLFNVKVRAKLC
ncbi:MAG: hypothetical protein F6J93_10315 [Oscillatoria sp. SIO1A7]|nr:hypothetical protein [Oscillatoria sp. SIO1A7]